MKNQRDNALAGCGLPSALRKYAVAKYMSCRERKIE
jgi:hypothetical protein